MSPTHRDLVKPARRLSVTRLRTVEDCEHWYKLITARDVKALHPGDRVEGGRVDRSGGLIQENRIEGTRLIQPRRIGRSREHSGIGATWTHGCARTAAVISLSQKTLQDGQMRRAYRIESQARNLCPSKVGHDAYGHHGILIQGEALTRSRFIDAGISYRLHLHLSAMILGSRRAVLDLRPIDDLSHARHVRARAYLLDDGNVLYDCPLRSKASGGSHGNA